MLKRLRYSLPSPAHEAALDEQLFMRRKGLLAGLLLFAAGYSAVQLPTMQGIAGATNATLGIGAVRLLVIGATLLLVVLVNRTETPRKLGRIASVWIAGLVASVVLENRLLPANHTAFAAWDVFMVFAIYAVIPLSVGRRSALALLLSVSDLAVLAQAVPPLTSAQLINLSLAYACANSVGLFVAWEIERGRRQQFLLCESEREARHRLETALAEIRTLRGIIPICSFCKSVRTDSDGWHEIEDYVRCRSDAEFSHGVCPSCMQQHYPGVVERG